MDMTTTNRPKSAAELANERHERKLAAIHPRDCECDLCSFFKNGDAPDITIDPAELAGRAPLPNGTGTGRGRTVEGPTTRQLDFLARLAAERGLDTPAVTTKRDASAAIERLLAIRPAAPADGETPVGRWVKRGSAWLVAIAGRHAEGDTVTVRKGDGTEQAVTLGVEYDPGVWNTVRTPRPAAPVECPEGIHRTADGRIFKVYTTQTSGNLAAKVLRVIPAVDGRAQHGEFDYVGQAPIRNRTLTAATLLDHDEAARFGALYGFCCACGHELETEQSLHAGYGPKCAKRNNWPWGQKQRVATA